MNRYPIHSTVEGAAILSESRWHQCGMSRYHKGNCYWPCPALTSAPEMDDINEHAATLDALTEKQREVLALVSEGMTSKEIARRLSISESAVNQRIEVIRQRLGGLPRTQIARLYRRMNTVLITIPTSNSTTGKSIQLQPDDLDAQQSPREGAGVSTALSQANNHFGSHPSPPSFLSTLLDGPHAAWGRFFAILLLAIGLLSIAVLVLTVLQTLAQHPLFSP